MSYLAIKIGAWAITGLAAFVLLWDASAPPERKLQPGEQWVQESILGTRFVGRFEWDGNTADSGKIIPTVTGTAHVTAEATLLVDARDPFCWGIRLD